MQEHSHEFSTWLKDLESAAPAEPIYMALDNYAVLACRGQDVKIFLQGQLTCNLDEVTSEQTQIGAYCDHKGRMLANFFIGQTQEDYYLVFPKNLYEVVHKELNKFAVFSKVQLSDVSADYQQLGLSSIKTDMGFIVPIKHIYPNQRKHLLILKPTSPDFDSLSFTKVETKYWELLNIRQGLIQIVPETIGMFTPHEINFAQIGGVSYDKGCYRGQEIIARMHYLGKLKQHLYHCRLQTDKKIIAGVELTTETQQHLGKIVNSFELGNNQFEILAVLYDAIAADQQQIELENNSVLNIIKIF